MDMVKEWITPWRLHKMELKTITSKLKQNNLYFKKINFKRSKEIPNNFNNSFDVNYEYENENTITVELITKIASKNKMSLEVILVGEFVLLEESNTIPEEEKKSILEKNTVAIMFPFLRSQITLITAQPNMPALNLPPLNINALLENIKEKKKKAQK